MCIGTPKIPSPEPRLPEAPTAPIMSAESLDRLRKRKASTNTILTGGQGVTDPAVTERKTLLGT